MTITGADVRAARGKESRKSFSQRVGITEAKVAGIEKGRAIREDEMQLLIAAGIVAGVGGSNGEVVAQTPPAPAPQVARVKSDTTRKTKSTPLADIELLDFDDDFDDDLDPLGIINVEPLGAPREATARELAPPGSRIVSNSEVSTFKRCRRKWWLAYYRGLEPQKRRFTGALNIGTRAHKALAEYYRPEGEPRTDPRDALERVLVEDWTEIESSTDDELVIQTIAGEFRKESNLLRAMIEGYVQWLEEGGHDEDLEVVAPEVALAAPFDVERETPVYITGRLDVRLRRRSDGARLLMDHKTCGDFTSKTRTLHMDPQMLHYHLLEIHDALRQRIEAGDGVHYEVEHTDGALYNMLRKVLRTERANPPFYQRFEVRHNKHELAAHRRDLTGVIEQMLILEAQLNAGDDPGTVAPKTVTDTCSWSCEYFAVCPMFDDGSRHDQFIENNFQTHDPYDRYPEFE